MSSESALLAAIRREPAEDTPRLAYADWLNERGGPGDADRAEFIRVQCRLAALEREKAALLDDETDWLQCTSCSAGWCPNCGDCTCPTDEHGDYPSRDDPGCPLHAPDSPHDRVDSLNREVDTLRRRERELWERYKCEWFGDRWAILHLGSPEEDSTVNYPDATHAFVTRGFPSHVTLGLRAFVGEPCGRCDGDGKAHGSDRPFEWSPDNPYPGKCPACSGSGYIGGLAAALAGAVPLEGVRLAGAEPQAWEAGGLYRWLRSTWDGPDHPPGAMIPDPIFDLLPESLGTKRPDWGFDCSTLSDAHAALSAACVAHARRLAGLPPL